MKFKSAIAVALIPMLLSACAGTAIGLRTTNSPSFGALPPPGPHGGAAIQADVSPNAYFGLMFLGFIVSGIQDNYRRWTDGHSSRTPPELAEDRSVAERDCSQPLGPLYANLRCK